MAGGSGGGPPIAKAPFKSAAPEEGPLSATRVRAVKALLTATMLMPRRRVGVPFRMAVEAPSRNSLATPGMPRERN